MPAASSRDKEVGEEAVVLRCTTSHLYADDEPESAEYSIFIVPCEDVEERGVDGKIVGAKDSCTANVRLEGREAVAVQRRIFSGLGTANDTHREQCAAKDRHCTSHCALLPSRHGQERDNGDEKMVEDSMLFLDVLLNDVGTPSAAVTTACVSNQGEFCIVKPHVKKVKKLRVE